MIASKYRKLGLKQNLDNSKNRVHDKPKDDKILSIRKLSVFTLNKPTKKDKLERKYIKTSLFKNNIENLQNIEN